MPEQSPAISPEEQQRQDREERRERLTTLVTGWLALVLGILGLHMWVAQGAINQWSRGGLILAVGLFVMWIWGYWPLLVDRLRQWVRSGGARTTIIAVAVIVSLIVVNAIARRRAVYKLDLTKNQRYTLSERSREILKSLSSPVEATVFIPAGRSTSTARDLFKQYGDASPNFNWKHVDPLTDQTTLLKVQPKLNQSDFTGAVIEYRGKREDVTEFTEKTITSAILKMTRDTKRKILFVQGHGEPEVSGEGAHSTDPTKSATEVVSDLKSSNWTVEGVNLYGKDVKPLDPAQVAVLVIAGPERELADEEAKRINEFLDKGGRVLLMLNMQGPSLSKFLAPWGIQSGDEIVLDRSQEGLVMVTADRNSHEAVRNGRRVLFQPLRAVKAITPAPTGITVTELLKSGQFSETVSGYRPGQPVDLAGAKPGPVGLAALAEKSIGTGDDAKKGRLIVVGDSTFMSDQLARLPSFYNVDLATGMINYLGEEDALVSIPAKDENTEQAFLTPDQSRLLPLIHLVDFPLLALVLAILVYLKRR